jgi:AcrR family transcriptional regulator
LEVVRMRRETKMGEGGSSEACGDAPSGAVDHSRTYRRPTRRRGDALVGEILDAAWDQLLEEGAAGFTVEAVAARARTSKPVIYRRWANRDELFSAVIVRRILLNPLECHDLGSLRADTLDILDQGNRKRVEIIVAAATAGVFIPGHLLTPERVRDTALAGKTSAMEVAVEQAILRGEIRISPPPLVVRVPFDLFKAQVLMSVAPVPTPMLEQIVDQVFLPLVHAYQVEG